MTSHFFRIQALESSIRVGEDLQCSIMSLSRGRDSFEWNEKKSWQYIIMTNVHHYDLLMFSLVSLTLSQSIHFSFCMTGPEHMLLLGYIRLY